MTIRQLLCGIFTHHDESIMRRGPQALFMECLNCGRKSPGWELKDDIELSIAPDSTSNPTSPLGLRPETGHSSTASDQENRIPRVRHWSGPDQPGHVAEYIREVSKVHVEPTDP